MVASELNDAELNDVFGDDERVRQQAPVVYNHVP